LHNRKGIQTKENDSTYPQVVFRNRWRKKLRENRLTEVHLEYRGSDGGGTLHAPHVLTHSFAKVDCHNPQRTCLYSGAVPHRVAL